MDKTTINAIAHMIEKECYRDSLVDLCEYWGVTVDDFKLFIETAIKACTEQSTHQ